MRSQIKRYFITGLLILLPVAITLTILVYLVNFLTAPFIELTRSMFAKYGLFQKGAFFLTAAQITSLFAQLAVLLFLFFGTIFLGFVARWIFVHTLMEWFEKLFQKTPLVGTIYHAIREVVHSFFSTDANAFTRVAMIPFPGLGGGHAIGLVSQEHCIVPNHPELGDAVVVFVPTTPNPTSGFLILFPRDQVIYLDIPVRDAMKYIMSCGVTPLSQLDPKKYTKVPVETHDA